MPDREFQWPEDGREHWQSRPNIQDEPEVCGLLPIDDLHDPNASYSFDTVMAFRDLESGGIYLAHSSGCSCPHPFEEYQRMADLIHVRTVEEARSKVQSWGDHGYDRDDGGRYTWPLRDINAFLEKVGRELRQELPW